MMNTRTLTYTTGHHDYATRARKHWQDSGRMVGQILAWLELYYERHRQRSTLARLNDRLLDDVGLQRNDVLPVVREPFWRL